MSKMFIISIKRNTSVGESVFFEITVKLHYLNFNEQTE